jgi:NADH-quinone oxidoreductase subunit A
VQSSVSFLLILVPVPAFLSDCHPSKLRRESPPMPSFLDPTILAGFVALFVAIGGAFLAVNLLVGWLVRPRMPNAEKLEVYECGEPAIGSSFVQFDLRFYVVALLFIIFDVEVALFFPWATVFGKATQLADPALQTVQADGVTLTPAGAGVLRELGLEHPVVPDFSAAVIPTSATADRAAGSAQAEPAVARGKASAEQDVSRAGGLLARLAVADMVTFFAVLLVGFAYVWNRGDLDWVRATSNERGAATGR